MQEEIELTEDILALEEFPQENRKLVDERAFLDIIGAALIVRYGPDILPRDGGNV